MDLNSLPTEMLRHIFSYLNPRHLCQLTGQVCETWRQLSYDPSLWKNVNLDQQTQSPNEIARIAQSSRLTRSLVLSRISDWTFTLSLPQNYNLRVIEFNTCDLTAFNLFSLVNAFPSVECVRVTYDRFDMRFVGEIAHWQFLKEITISSNEECFRDGNECLSLLTDKCPHLETLSLSVRLILQDTPLLDFVKFHGLKLRKLTALFNSLSSNGFSFLAQCTNLIDLDLNGPINMNGVGLRHLKGMKFLEKLRISLARSLIPEDYISLFENHVFGCLLDLKIDCCKGINDLVIEHISKSCPNIKNLRLYDCKDISDGGIKHVVSGCRSIENLTLNMIPNITGSCFAELSNEILYLEYLRIYNCSKFNEEIFFDLKSKRPGLYISGFKLSETSF